MTLKEIIQHEEKLLIIDDKYKYLLTFTEVVRLKRYMQNVGDITNIYFDLIKNYHNSIRNDGTTMEIVNDMYDYNTELQNSEVDTDIINMNEVIGFINIICTKYSIEFKEDKNSSDEQQDETIIN